MPDVFGVAASLERKRAFERRGCEKRKPCATHVRSDEWSMSDCMSSASLFSWSPPASGWLTTVAEVDDGIAPPSVKALFGIALAMRRVRDSTPSCPPCASPKYLTEYVLPSLTRRLGGDTDDAPPARGVADLGGLGGDVGFVAAGRALLVFLGSFVRLAGGTYGTRCSLGSLELAHLGGFALATPPPPPPPV